MCLIFGSGRSTTRPCESSPENCTVAPSSESIIEPSKPAIPPNKMIGHCGGLEAKMFRSTVYITTRKYDNPIAKPPRKLKTMRNSLH